MSSQATEPMDGSSLHTHKGELNLDFGGFNRPPWLRPCLHPFGIPPKLPEILLFLSVGGGRSPWVTVLLVLAETAPPHSNLSQHPNADESVRPLSSSSLPTKTGL
ncbi:hypothetical protein H6P81_003720 [Aristolochia fimbriata]|uniref:Uncharacterized protein n=1 Tax=Aristolochia fimbriata TaxID=158543 RepID=A0AAV7FH88_ARIFI|nr:hypothetical protein H6P81_003720 [Aristolochia fimbriata]